MIIIMVSLVIIIASDTILYSFKSENISTDQLETTTWQRGAMISLLLNSEDVMNFKINGDLIKNLWSDKNYGQLSDELQYQESKELELVAVEDQENHNYEANAVDEAGEEVTINVALFPMNMEIDKYGLVVSFLNEDLSVNINKAKVLSDDSNAEQLALLIMKELKNENNLDLTEEEISLKYFGNTIEEIAGSISYHAIITYILTTNNVQNGVLTRAEVVNISKGDADGFFVNRKY